jgi:heme exporter protein D
VDLIKFLKDSLWNLAAFVWGAAEATLFFVVPDVLLSFIGLKQGLRAGLIASMCAALGASLGGAAIYVWSSHDLAHAQSAILAVPAINAAMVERAWHAMVIHGWFTATVQGPLTRTPFKIYALLAPHIGAGLNAFAVASIFARLPRFLFVSLGAALAQMMLGRHLTPRQLSLGLGATWVIFYAFYWATTPS